MAGLRVQRCQQGKEAELIFSNFSPTIRNLEVCSVCAEEGIPEGSVNMPDINI